MGDDPVPEGAAAIDVGVDEIRRNLLAARHAGRLFTRRVRIPIFISSALCTLSGIALWVLLAPAQLGTALVLLSFPMVLFALLPTDRVLVRAVACCGVAVSVASIAVWTSVSVLLVLGIVAREGEGGQCRTFVAVRPCWFVYVGLCLTVASSAALVLHALALLRSLRLPPRLTLDAHFRALGALYLELAPVVLTYAVILSLMPPTAAPGETALTLAAAYFSALQLLALGVLVRRPHVRSRVQGWLAARTASASVSAGIGALMSARPVGELTEFAHASFRCISAEHLAREHLSSAAPDPALFRLSAPATFGQVDAFVSHSWHDDADAKWAALQAWRADFRRAHRREPQLWLDKACIAADAISDTLAALPLFLAGCDTLVLLLGDTVLERVWCAAELFMFVAMGAARSRIQVRVLGAAHITISAVQAFSVEQAQCDLAEDKERLLTMIEASADGVHGFNALVRETLLRAITDGGAMPGGGGPRGSGGAAALQGAVSSAASSFSSRTWASRSHSKAQLLPAGGPRGGQARAEGGSPAEEPTGAGSVLAMLQQQVGLVQHTDPHRTLPSPPRPESKGRGHACAPPRLSGRSFTEPT